LTDSSNPARPGDVVVVYCGGLGAVTPKIDAGTAGPLTQLLKTVSTVTATVQGLPAKVEFAGLTPGSVGLYQVNLRIPDGIVDADTAVLQLSVDGQLSPTVGLSLQR